MFLCVIFKNRCAYIYMCIYIYMSTCLYISLSPYMYIWYVMFWWVELHDTILHDIIQGISQLPDIVVDIVWVTNRVQMRAQDQTRPPLAQNCVSRLFRVSENKLITKYDNKTVVSQNIYNYGERRVEMLKNVPRKITSGIRGYQNIQN